MAVLPLRPLMYLGRSITSPLKCCHTEYRILKSPGRFSHHWLGGSVNNLIR
jgi:hypothetical protein